MFDKDKLSHDGAQAQALVLEKRVYGSEVETGRASACRYELRVRFPDGSTTEISRRVFGHTAASAAVGDLIPVRYDPADRSNLEIDRRAIAAQRDARARALEDQAIARGEQQLAGISPGTLSGAVDEEQRADTGELRIGDRDRELIAGVLNRHMAEGRLTVEELDDRLGALYASQTREQARSLLAELPPLTGDSHYALSVERQGATPALPDWLSITVPASSHSSSSSPASGTGGRPSPSAGAAGAGPTDEEMGAAHQAWRAKVTQAKADKAAHKRAEATGDRKETFLAFRRLAISRAEEKSARAKFDRLRILRPDWTDNASPSDG
jgi:hypothetical protein